MYYYENILNKINKSSLHAFDNASHFSFSCVCVEIEEDGDIYATKLLQHVLEFISLLIINSTHTLARPYC